MKKLSALASFTSACAIDANAAEVSASATAIRCIGDLGEVITWL